MRSITELFDFLSNCNKETILTELNDHRRGILNEKVFKIFVNTSFYVNMF